jgi:hypothetical protein
MWHRGLVAATSETAAPPSAATRPGSRRRLTPGGLLVAAALIAVLVVLCRRVGDPDFWWHLATGRWVLGHGQLPTTELFTYTVTDRPWVDQEYGSEILLALLYQGGGFLAVSLVYTAVTWAGFWAIWRRIAIERVPAPIAAACLLLGAAAGVVVWGPRSQMISFALTCLTLLWVEAYLRDRHRHLYLLPLVMVAWANLHGGFVYGLGVVGVAAVSESLMAVFTRGDAAHRRRAMGLWAVLATCSVAGLVNPNTYKVYAVVVAIETSKAQQSFIAEWQSPSFHSAGELGLEALLLLTVTAMAVRRQRLWDVLLSLAAIYLALAAVRNVSISQAMLVPVVAWAGADVWRRSRWREPLAMWVHRHRIDVLAACSACTLIAAAVTGGIMASTLSGQTASTDANFPVGAADWLAAHPNVGTRMLNAYDWGGYLIYRFSAPPSDVPPPDRRVFVYGEATLMGNALVQEIADVENAQTDWQSILSRNRVDYVVERTDSSLSMALGVDPQWRKVYDDGFAVIFVKR